MAELNEEQINKVVQAAELISRCLDGIMRIDEEINLAASSGTNNLKFDQVESGRELVLRHLSGYNDTSSPTKLRVGYWNGHGYNWLTTQPAPLVSETVGISASVHLREGMYPIVRFEGCTSGDDLYAALNGYWIKTK